MPNQTIVIILLGAVTGFVAGLAGIGGGIVIIPVLVMLLGYSQHQAQGTAISLLSIPVSIAAAWTYYRSGFVDLRIVGFLAIGFVVGGYFGAKVAVQMPNVLLQRLFGVLLITIGLRMVVFAK